ncbi:MAG: hypothetical protein D6757_08665 [Alphaproteobacteria bacterium]|nr:MAG: hypothetical protein D6757_08665 [Alphaproteobacteria bacterium]
MAGIERTREIPRSEWREYFDRISKSLEGKLAEVEVAALTLGDQVEAEWVPIHGIVYDHKDDIFEVALEGLDHLIAKPVRVWVEEGPEGLVAIEIEDVEGETQIIRLREPLALPSPEKA